ncbi:PKD domain-containing protein [Prevotella intermedia]|jgi:putative surface layer protein B|uniref:PKD domain-containing protein n=1 Tax=Prevotella intermedia TaxID=28131 RepID=A0AAJ3RGP2_PREIN|nr:PKD domain-containing protein [Prevotella intermedia]ATV39079.1 PKD domain-containing protein [Prevotella intermedia]AWX08364.1 PKD domain-containing protein [Prevotella intermedia]PIK17418.1 PKD domain-containing protein [Prevotella intermedia]
MTERQKIILAIVSALAVAGLLVALLLPSRTIDRKLDFYIQDQNANNQLEVNEPLKFTINDSSAVADKRVLWKMGNGDSIVGHPNISYIYRQAGKYLVTLQVDGKIITEKTIDVVKITKDTVAVDSIPKIVGPTQGFVGEKLVFSADGDGMTSWLWEFGESGTIDAFERQVVYKYDEPGKYLVKLKTNTTLYPVSHVITILAKGEDILETPEEVTPEEPAEPIDTLALVQNDIKKHLQAIANTSTRDRETFYSHRNYIINKYLRGNANQVIVHVNGERYSVFPDYCQGLHFLESNRYGRVTIDDVKVDDFHHIIKIEVTQRNTRK